MRFVAPFVLILGCSSTATGPAAPVDDAALEDVSEEVEDSDAGTEPEDSARADTRTSPDSKPAVDTAVADTAAPVDSGPASIANVVSVATGYTHTCAVLADGTLRCTGQNEVGQLGDGTLIRRYVPVAAMGLSNVVAAAAGGTHTCAKRMDKTVSCFGANNRGQLGDGTTVDRRTAAAVTGLANVEQLVAGESHTCALLTDATVKCWGYNFYGQLGDGTTTTRTTPVSVVGLSNVKSITLGTRHTCALLTDRTMKCWGEGGMLGSASADQKTPIAVPGLSDLIAIGAGANHTCAVVGTGPSNKVFCFGTNTFGQLGDGTLTDRVTPVLVSGISDVVDITGGSVYSCAHLASGSARCWGSAQLGSMGDGTFAPTYGAKGGTIPLTTIRELNAGGGQACARLVDESLWCWGRNDNGYLGDGSSENRSTPVRMRAGM